MEESIFVDERLLGVDSDENEPLLPSTSSPEPVPTFTLEAEAPQATTSSTTAVKASWVEGEIISEPGAPSHIQKAHPPQQIICNMNEKGNMVLEVSSSLLFHKYALYYPF
jgi:hypothetical protein